MREMLRRLARQPLSRRRLFQGGALLLGAGLFARWLTDRPAAQSDVLGMQSHVGDWAPAANAIDVREFKKSMTVEALNETAEQYFASIKDWEGAIAKPLASVDDAPALLNHFAHLLNGLQLSPGMTVLDFGAGTCWASRWLTQLGMQVIALDVSRTALKMGEALYARQPVLGKRPAPRFLPFDGRRIELADASVDRILCLDTLHHLLNPDEVLREMGRILKPGAIAGFSEPGPRHSRSFQSQYEMRNYKVLEDDVDIHRVWEAARAAGFQRLRVAVFSPHTLLLSLAEFDEYLKGGDANRQFAENTRERMEHMRVFFLQKGPLTPVLDSTRRAHLEGKLEATVAAASVKAGAPLRVRVVVTNSGRATWLPRSAPHGGVALGCRLFDANGQLISLDYGRYPLTPGEGRAIAPGETLTVELEVPAPAKGRYILEWDLVAESVGWFSAVGLVPPRVNIEAT